MIIQVVGSDKTPNPSFELISAGKLASAAGTRCTNIIYPADAR
jgi:hypothetical protein